MAAGAGALLRGADTSATLQTRGWTYDADGRVTFASYPGTTDALATGTWTDYDALGRVTSVSQDSELGVLTTVTGYLSDAAGPYTLVTSPLSKQTRTWYQMFDQPDYSRPIRIWQPEAAVTHISRDVFGKTTRIRRNNSGDVNGGTVALDRSYAYNANQELCRTVEPETGATLMGYDGAGNLAWSAAGLPATTACEANGTSGPVVLRKASRTYDARNRVKTLVFPDGRGNTTNTYTPDGQLATTVVDNDGTNVVTTAYTHNRRRLLTQERTTWGSMDWSIGYTYTPLGHLASHTYPNGQTVAYVPNALGQPTQAGPYATGVQYYPNGGMKQFSYGNGIVHTMTQNARQLPARSTDSNGVLDLGYAYDKHANVTGITDYTTGARQSRSMIYNGLDQLLQTTGASFGTANYSYNVLDNLTSVKVTAGSHVRNHTYHYDAGNRLTSVTNAADGATVVGLQYDPQGNLSNKNGQGYTFDFGNRLRAADSLVSYYYDGHGRRVRDVTAAGSKYSQYSLGGQLMYANDVRQGVGTQYVYLNGSLVAFRESTGVVKYQHTDALGTPIAVTDAAKAIVQTSEYEPYGRLVNRALTDGPGFTGHVQDAATGLTYMQQRYYDPVIGRFLSVDPVTAYSSPGANFNRYWYANNNPYCFIDPDGRISDDPNREPRGGVKRPPPPPCNADCVKMRQASDRMQTGGWSGIGAVPARTEDLEVIFWEPVGRGRSSLGHVSVRVGSVSYSFASGGMDVREFSTYRSANSFRDGHGLVVKLTPDQMAVVVSTLKNYDKQYNYIPNNCTTPVQDALLAATGLGIQSGMRNQAYLPDDLESVINNSFDVSKTNYYPKRDGE